MSGMLTTSNNFPCEDVTHRPLRTQSGNLHSDDEQQITARVAVSAESISYPSSYTPERAIAVYKNLMETANSVELRNLYKWTIETLTKISSKTVDSEGKA